MNWPACEQGVPNGRATDRLCFFPFRIATADSFTDNHSAETNGRELGNVHAANQLYLSTPVEQALGFIYPGI